MLIAFSSLSHTHTHAHTHTHTSNKEREKKRLHVNGTDCGGGFKGVYVSPSSASCTY